MGKTWDQLRTRGWQELAKRWDLVSYRFGVPFGGGARLTETQERAHFLFEPEDVPSLMALLRETLPQQVEEIVRRAERICRHQFDLLGYEHLDYGPEIDWHLEIVHQKRAPRKPWFRIRYLDFAEVGDVKITWELNRHQHLITLAKAYRLTGNQQFAVEAFRQWYHWWQANPYPIGVNWASSLEVGFRSLSWLWVQHLLDGCPLAPKNFPSDLSRALSISGRHIERYLSTFFSPNTHLLGEGVALLFIGTLCPQLRAAKRWKRRGWEIVLQEAARQVQADGMHFEQSVYYHVYALDFFLHARMLAAANQISIPPAFDLTLERMLEVLCVLSQTGALPRLGDDDGGRVFDPQRNRAQHLLDPLGTGAALFGRGDFKTAANLSEETIWLVGLDGIAKFEQLPNVRPAPRTVGFQTSGIYVMAATEPVPQQVVVDAGRLGTGRAGHSHSDALSLCLAVNGREWIIDPGTFVYITEGDERNFFRGTASHNTLQIDGVNQAEPWKPFAWRSQPEVRVETWIPGGSFSLIVASHSGYCRLRQPVLHRRCVFHLKSRFWLVLDLAEGDGSHNLEIFWHLAPGSIPLEKPRGYSCFMTEDQSTLDLLTAKGHNWTQEISSGWWSQTYGKKEPCPVLRFQTEAQLPAEFATLLHPVRQAGAGLGHLVKMKIKEGVGGVIGYLYRTPLESHYVFVMGHGKRWESGPWASDAAFLYCGMGRRDGLRHLALCGGTFVELDGRCIFAAQRPVARCEWFKKGAAHKVCCSDEEAIDLLPEGNPSGQEVELTRDRARDLEPETS